MVGDDAVSDVVDCMCDAISDKSWIKGACGIGAGCGGVTKTRRSNLSNNDVVYVSVAADGNFNIFNNISFEVDEDLWA